MKILKKREKPLLLRQLEALDKRMVLSEETALHMLLMLKGFIGEVLFDEWMEKFLKGEVLILRDLLFTDKGSSFQIDCLVITAAAIYLYEVKNYEGNYQFRDGRFLNTSGADLKNPLTKFDDTVTKTRQLLRKWNITLPLRPYLVFVNADSTLYNVSPEMPVLLPHQIEKHFSQVNQSSRGLTKKHHWIAEVLLGEHQEEAAFQRKLPHYTYESLEKGLWCAECGSRKLALTQRLCLCRGCSGRFMRDEAVVFNLNELRLLFPELKLTSKLAHDWIGEEISLKMVCRIAKRNFDSHGVKRGTYFE